MLMVYAFVHDPPYLRRQRGSGRIDYLGYSVAVALGLFQIVLAVADAPDVRRAVGALRLRAVRSFDDRARSLRVALSRTDHRFPDGSSLGSR